MIPPSPTQTPSPTVTPSVTPTISLTPSVTPTITLTPSMTPSSGPAFDYLLYENGDIIETEQGDLLGPDL